MSLKCNNFAPPTRETTLSLSKNIQDNMFQKKDFIANTKSTFRPKMAATIRQYDRKTFSADLMAGLITGIVALPLAIAFGIASGVSPEKGIITAIVAGFIISAFGGSKVQIGGPTGAFIVIVYGIIENYGMQGLTIATLMAGVFLILLGLPVWGPSSSISPTPLSLASPAVLPSPYSLHKSRICWACR